MSRRTEEEQKEQEKSGAVVWDANVANLRRRGNWHLRSPACFPLCSRLAKSAIFNFDSLDPGIGRWQVNLGLLTDIGLD